MKFMKLLLQTLACMLLIAVCASACAQEAVNCYWQLDAVRVETFAEESGCDALAVAIGTAHGQRPFRSFYS